MNWGLRQGMLGRQQTLNPSMTAVGGNTYLQSNDFLKTIAVAMVLHVLILGISAIWPEQEVTDIPVRALTFKIGGGERIPHAVAIGSPVAPQPIVTTPPSQWRASPQPVKPVPRPQPVKPAKIVPLVPPTQRQAPLDNPQQRTAPAEQPKPPTALPDTSVLTTQAAIAPTPQRFIREMPLVPAGAQLASAAESAQAVRARYEQEISGWIQKHYPQNIAAGQRKVRPVIRVRIDRSGYVRYYALEQSSGSDALDASAIDMIRRANPMPAVPDTYPAGNLIEFLIPIVFRVP